MESLNFPNNKLPPSALIESFNTSTFFLPGLLGRLLLLLQPRDSLSSPPVPAPTQGSLSGKIF